MKIILKLRHRTPPQRRISESQARFNVAAWGRQSGKTTFGIDKLIWKPMLGRKEGVYWYVLQTYDAATVAFRRYKKIATPLLIEKPNESELKCILEGGRTIFFKSGFNYEDLRVETLDGCVIDEVRQQHPDLWPKVIRPMLSRRKGWCDFLSTTNGYEHFYELWEFAQTHPEEWATFHAPSSEAWWWTPEEIASARATMTESEFAQEILAEFREMGKGKVYTSHGVHNHLEQNPFTSSGAYSPYLPIVVGLDFNVGLMAWVLMQNRGEDFYIQEEICVSHTNTEETAQVLLQKVKNHKLGVVLVGDASGKANKTSASGNTDYSILMSLLKSAGVPVRNLTPEANPSVKDRVNLMNSRLRSADGAIHLWYSPLRCPRLKKDLERVTWKVGATGALFDKSNLDLTHVSDAASYPVAYYSNHWKTKPGMMRVIQRA